MSLLATIDTGILGQQRLKPFSSAKVVGFFRIEVIQAIAIDVSLPVVSSGLIQGFAREGKAGGFVRLGMVEHRLSNLGSQSLMVSQVGQEGDQVLLLLARERGGHAFRHKRRSVADGFDVIFVQAHFLAGGWFTQDEFGVGLTDFVALQRDAIRGQDLKGLVLVFDMLIGPKD